MLLLSNCLFIFLSENKVILYHVRRSRGTLFKEKDKITKVQWEMILVAEEVYT